jgi:hypothetical protein
MQPSSRFVIAAAPVTSLKEEKECTLRQWL